MNVRQKSTSVEEVKVRSHTLHICYEGIVCLTEWLCVPSGKRMNVGSNPAVGAGFFSGEENWCLL